MIKPAYSVSFLLSINIFVWQNVLYFLDAPPNLEFQYFNRSNEGNSVPRLTFLAYIPLIGKTS